MSPAEFRRRGYQTIDWIADYLEQVERLPVLSQAEPGQLRARLPESPPTEPEAFDGILRDLDELILPGVTHWQSPNFFAYFPCNNSGPSILGDLVSSGLGVQGMLWSTSPACTELESHVLDWLTAALGLPERFLSSGTGGGVIQDSASSAALCALLAARQRALDGDSAAEPPAGGRLDRLTAYASSQAHSSIEKAVRIAGLSRALRLIDVDPCFAMQPEALGRRMDEDRAAGLQPTFVTATIGTTSSNAMDPLGAIAKHCLRHGAWLHVDAAMSGTAALCEEFRYTHEGLEHADSYCFNPHKWMFTNFDCDCFYVADRRPLIGALSVLPEYLRNRATESGAVIDYRDWQVSLGRRFRALKLWFVLRHYGLRGLRHHVRRHVDLAQRFAEWIRRDEQFELAAPVPLNLVCFRHRGGDAINQAILDDINASGRLFLTHTKLDGRLTLRMSIGQSRTERRHVDRAWQLIQRAADSA
ncbi:MAG: aspartate aminotransferase family protein [Deltaproteobacteria bacterium]|nr:aspartate aminotransferase family protein [Deltaproteobacteria bacterium]MBW2537218.1 aspartate aminotransferase family protein [Deltaproteobacteria bacterium]